MTKIRNASFFQHLNHRIIIFRPMGKRTVTAHLNPLPARFQIRRVARTVCPDIQRTVAEQTVAFLQILMTGEILTCSVFKKPTGMFHNLYPFLIKSGKHRSSYHGTQSRHNDRKAAHCAFLFPHLHGFCGSNSMTGSSDGKSSGNCASKTTYSA